MPRILLLADYSNFHNTLAKGLRKLGCEVTVASDGSNFMNCNRDIDISRKPGKIGGALFYAEMLNKTRNLFSGYDIVSFRDPAFLELKPQRIRKIMERVMTNNKNCFLSYITTDIPFLDMLEAKDSPLKYSEWFVNGKPNRLFLEDKKQWESWHGEEMRKLNEIFYSKIKGAVTSLYEYHLSARRVFREEDLAYGGLPIDTDSIPAQELSVPDKVRIFLGRDNRRKLQKGSDLLEEAARNVVSRHPGKAELVILENKPREEYMEIMRSCHVMLDQIYSYTPATMALEGMASGLTVVTGAEPEFYDFIGEKDLFPIVNAPVDEESLEKAIEDLVINPIQLEKRSREGRKFVEKHHNKEVVASRFLDFWQKKIRS